MANGGPQDSYWSYPEDNCKWDQIRSKTELEILTDIYKRQGYDIDEALRRARKEILQAEIFYDAKDLGRATGGQKAQRKEENAPVITSQDLLAIQRTQQAMTLLAGVPAFTGDSMSRFDDWIQHFELICDSAGWNEEERLAMLTTKLTGKACKALVDFKTNRPREARSYRKTKEAILKRFHGGETEDYYIRKFNKCDRKPKESIIEYAYRLKEVFNHAHPQEEGENEPAQDKLRYKLLRNRFLQGIEEELSERVKFKDCESFEELVDVTTKYAASYDEKKEAREKREFIQAVTRSSGEKELEELTKIVKSLAISQQSRLQDKPTSYKNELSNELKELKELVAAGQKQKETVNAVNFGSYRPNLPHPLGSTNQGTPTSSLEEAVVSLTKKIEKLEKKQALKAAASSNSLGGFPPEGQYFGQPRMPTTQGPWEWQQQQGGTIPNQHNQMQTAYGFQRFQQNYPRGYSYTPRQFQGQFNPSSGWQPRFQGICQFCGSRGHDIQDCRKFGYQQQKASSSPICYNCRQTGHYAINCPNNNAGHTVNRGQANVSTGPVNQGNE